MHEKIINLKGENLRGQLDTALGSANPFFAGYKKALAGFADKMAEGDRDYAKKISAEINRLNKASLRLGNKINDMDEDGFDGKLKKLLLKEKDRAGIPFREAIREHLDKTTAKGSGLKFEILQFLAPMLQPETRRYRNDDKDPVRNYISYMIVGAGSGILYDVGFSYVKYRKFLSPDARNLLFILIGLFFIMVFVFPNFFSGALVKPLNSLLSGVREIRNDHLDVNIPVFVKDEIGFLTQNFNEMAATMKKAKEQIHDYATNLEQKVQERTDELNATNEELEAINETLLQARDELWGEMQLARKIQMALLPKKPEIQGFEVSACMLPADEVGGDYYDIISMEGYDWVTIGDVSGHGVIAGLIMMMVQTSIRSVLIGEPGLQPEVLLTRVNKIISENIKKLGEDKYMTITVIACLKDGKFFYSGLHQDIMVYRAAAKSVEIVETKGLWIGVSDDLAGKVRDDQLLLERGDVMLLYTDGLTEGKIKMVFANEAKKDDEMFGDDRLKECLMSMGDKTTEEIMQGILEKLKKFRADDDRTMVILKKN